MTPHELEQGRALLAKATEAPWTQVAEPETGSMAYVDGPGNCAVASTYNGHNVRPEAEENAALIVWLRNHAAELMDLAAIGLGRTCYDASAEALEDSRAHADRLADVLSKLEWVGGDYEDCCPQCCAGKKWPQGHEPDCALARALAVHAARREKEKNDAASQ